MRRWTGNPASRKSAKNVYLKSNEFNSGFTPLNAGNLRCKKAHNELTQCNSGEKRWGKKNIQKYFDEQWSKLT